MITVLEYALLSNHTYHPEKAKFFDTTFKEYRKSQTVKPDDTNWYIVTDIPSQAPPTQNFYAQLYLRFQDGKPEDAVVAYRGTVPSDVGNDAVDIISWYSDATGEGSHDSLPDYFPQALSFYFDAMEYMQQYFSDCWRISVTGHSLGAALAQLIPAYAMQPALAVTFNSPGIGHIDGVNEDMAGFVHGINSHYGFINKVGKRFGSVTPVNIPEDESQAIELTYAFGDKDYQESKSHYQVGDSMDSTGQGIGAEIQDLEGFGDRIAAYFKTKHTVSQFASTKAQDAKFKNETLFSRLIDEGKVDAEEYGKVIVAQHSIDNMVAALCNPVNAKIAFKSFI